MVIFLSRFFVQGPCLTLVCQGGDGNGVDELSFGVDGDIGVFQEQCKLVADVVCFLDSCFDFSVKSSIFCKYATEVLDLGHLLKLSAVDVDVEFAGFSTHLHCLGLADVDVVFAGCSTHLHCLGLADVDVVFAGCSTHLHCLGLADADLHVVFVTVSVQAVCMLLQLLFVSFARLWSSANNISFKASGSVFASSVILSM